MHAGKNHKEYKENNIFKSNNIYKILSFGCWSL